jgi:hypothetical protein
MRVAAGGTYNVNYSYKYISAINQSDTIHISLLLYNSNSLEVF